jgi:hypothetical protein
VVSTFKISPGNFFPNKQISIPQQRKSERCNMGDGPYFAPEDPSADFGGIHQAQLQNFGFIRNGLVGFADISGSENMHPSASFIIVDDKFTQPFPFVGRVAPLPAQ